MLINKKLTAIFIGLNAILLIIPFRFSENILFRTLKSNSYSHINYDSGFDKTGLSKFQEFMEADKSTIKSVDINFKMKVFSISNWNNVFQTADLNDGIRMELSAPSTVGLLVGYMNAIKDTVRGYELIHD